MTYIITNGNNVLWHTDVKPEITALKKGQSIYESQVIPNTINTTMTMATDADEDGVVGTEEVEINNGFEVDLSTAKNITAEYVINDLVEKSTITLSNGVVLSANEKAQERMARAVLALPDDTTTIKWVAADGTVAMLTKPDLQEALLLAGTETSSIWDLHLADTTF